MVGRAGFAGDIDQGWVRAQSPSALAGGLCAHLCDCNLQWFAGMWRRIDQQRSPSGKLYLDGDRYLRVGEDYVDAQHKAYPGGAVDFVPCRSCEAECSRKVPEW